jgi:hypothetical protein
MTGEPDRQDHGYRASLRVFSPSLRLDDLRDRLGEPTNGHDIGDPVSSTPGARTWPDTAWRLESSVDRTRGLDEHVVVLVEYVEARRPAFAALPDTCSIDIFCGLFAGDSQGGFTFRPSLLARLAELRLPVGFDLYSIVEPAASLSP